MPSIAELEQWMEEQLPPNLHDLPMKVTSTIQSYSSHLYSQLYDLTPSYSQIESSIESSLHNIPFVGAHCTSTTPPPPPPPVSILEAIMLRADAATGSRTRTSIVASVGVVGITCAIITRSAWLPIRLRKRGIRSPKIINGSRQEAIIVLGADTPLGQSLCHLLSAQGFIVLASVSDEDSMQVFDSLIPPSSRGYIKSIILNPTKSRLEGIDYFIQSIASAKELRWPLTSAGDPYSRPGTEVQITALINALSYKSISEKSSISSMNMDQLSKDLIMRVSTPLATIQALLPQLSTESSSSCTFIVSIIAPDSEISSRALIAGMKDLKEKAALKGRSKILFTTLEAQSSSLQTRFLSLLPSRIGGGASLTSHEIKTPSSSLASSRVTDTKGQPVDKTPIRPRNSPRTASGSDVRLQRYNEFKPLLQAVASIVLKPLSTSNLQSRYNVQLPASMSIAQESHNLEKTVLLGALRISSIPFIVLASALGRMNLNPSCWLSSWNRSGATYSGSRNASNSRPAYGPGPGPASNTHSRSCIRPDISHSSKRPRSATSTASSEAAKSTEANSTGPPSSAATASGPPSNNGMSSSGLLSSVPSSAFGDGSEEEHFDFEDGDNSPIQGSGPWASPTASDHDSDTALGQRTESLNDTDATPSGSRANIEQVQYGFGFPSQASMESSGEESWMGPASRGSSTPSEPPAATAGRPAFTANNAVPGTPLGQSWVAVDESI